MGWTVEGSRRQGGVKSIKRGARKGFDEASHTVQIKVHVGAGCKYEVLYRFMMKAFGTPTIRAWDIR